MKERIGGKKSSDEKTLEAIPIDENYENKEYYTLNQAIDEIVEGNRNEILLNEDSNGSKQILRRSGKAGNFGEGLILFENGEPQKFIKVLFRPKYLFTDEDSKDVRGAEKGYFQANHAHYLLAKDYFEKNKDFLKEKLLFPEEFEHLESLLKKLEGLDKGAESYHPTDDKEYIKQVTFINYLYNYIENYKYRVEAMDETEKDIKLEFPFPKFHAAFTTEGGKVCTTIDIVQGETLDKSRDKFDSPEKNKKYFESLINKVHLLHKFNFVHGDLKPDNVMESDEIFLIDNGFVQHTSDNEIYYMNNEWRTTALIALYSFTKTYVDFDVLNSTYGFSQSEIEYFSINKKFEAFADKMGLSQEQVNFLFFLASDDRVQTSIMEASDELVDKYYNMNKFSNGLKIQELEKFVMYSLEMEDLEGIDKEKIELFEKMQKAINKGLPKYLKEIIN